MRILHPTIETLEQRQLLSATITFGNAEAVKYLSFLDSDGTAVRASLAGGTGTAVIAGEGINQTPGRLGGLILSGNGLWIESLTVDNAVNARLTIQASGGADGYTTVGGLTVNGTLANLNAPGVNLQGNVTSSGDMVQVRVRSITDATVTDNGSARAMWLTVAGNVYNSTITDLGRIQNFRASAVIGSEIEAWSMGQLYVTGVFSADLQLSSPGQSLNIARFGRIEDGVWYLTGGVGRLTAGASGGVWEAHVGGHLAFASITEFDGELWAYTAGTVLTRNMTGWLDITRPFSNRVALQRLSVTGTMTGGIVGANDNIGMISVGRAERSYFYVGLYDSFMAQDSSDFVTDASIASFRSGTFSDSVISASRLGTVALGIVLDGQVSGHGFGVVANSARLINGSVSGKRFQLPNLNANSNVNQLLARQGMVFASLHIGIGHRTDVTPTPSPIDPGNDQERFLYGILEIDNALTHIGRAGDHTSRVSIMSDPQILHDEMVLAKQSLLNAMFYRDRLGSGSAVALSSIIVRTRDTAILWLRSESDYFEREQGAYVGWAVTFGQLADEWAGLA